MRQNNPPPMRGRPRTFEDLHAAYAARVLVLVWLLGVTEADRLDMAQEVWLAAFRRLESYDAAGCSAPTWLAGIARNVVMTWRRTKQRRPEFSTSADDAAELLDERTPETATEEQRRAHALRALLFFAIPDQERRETFILHEYFGETIAEVAKTTDVPAETVERRLKMARRDLERAKAAMSDEDREKFRALVAPFATVDDLIEGMRPKVSDEDIAKVWDGVMERIKREGIEPDNGVAEGAPPAPPAVPLGSPLPGFALRGGKLAGALGGTFLVGALAGAGTLYAWLSRDSARETSIAMIETTQQPAPVVPMEPTAAPLLSARAVPLGPSSAERDAAALSTTLLARARAALATAPAHARAFADEHARRYPQRHAAQREEVAICALVQLGRRTEAEPRAERLVKMAPAFRPEMETLFDRPFL
jgi:RNA polymerase sigma-70 factor, ECF subfamily